MPDVILTGIPRSGTTLAAALVDGMPGCVALNEPGWQVTHPPSGKEAFAKSIFENFAEIRRRLLGGIPVPDRRGKKGEALTDYFRRQGDGMEEAYGIMPLFRKGLTKDFTLAVKHNGPYLAVLPELAAMKHFTIVAILRHPVEVIHSWRTLSLPISRGEMHTAASYWPEVERITQSSCGLLEKQVRLYDAMCARMHEMRREIHILPYETLIKNPDALSQILKKPASRNTHLIRKTSAIPPEERQRIGKALETCGTHWREFYSL